MPTAVQCLKSLLRYIQELKFSRIILWCYLIWYLVMISCYFDPNPKIWLNSLGISGLIGTALVLSVSSRKRNERDHWQTFRLYLMPFCVSSFSALIKDQGFWIFISPKVNETLMALSCCCLFVVGVMVIKLVSGKKS